MKINVTGIWNSLGMGTELPAAKAIAVPHGQVATLSVTVRKDDGTTPDLRNAVFTFRLISPVAGSQRYQTTGAGTILGTGELTINPTNLEVGSYHWDLWLLPSGGTITQVIPLGSWMILQTSR